MAYRGDFHITVFSLPFSLIHFLEAILNPTFELRYDFGMPIL